MTNKPHAFVALPFSAKPGSDGQLIDFNRIYKKYIKPALEAAGLERLVNRHSYPTGVELYPSVKDWRPQ
jgi:hypothetical protein